MNQRWLYKLENKFGHICIPNLMFAIVVGQGLVYVTDMFVPAIGLVNKLALYWPYVLQGQVWRLLTFIFVPQVTSPLWLALTLYFEYIIGKMLESAWGAFRFNVYYFCGVIGAILASAISGTGTAMYLNTSLFWALAMLYPDMQVLLFFVIPIKIKYLAYFSAAMVLLNLLLGAWYMRAAILLSFLNFLLFFGGDFYRRAREYFKYAKQRRQWRANNRNYRP